MFIPQIVKTRNIFYRDNTEENQLLKKDHETSKTDISEKTEIVPENIKPLSVISNFMSENNQPVTEKNQPVTENNQLVTEIKQEDLCSWECGKIARINCVICGYFCVSCDIEAHSKGKAREHTRSTLI